MKRIVVGIPAYNEWKSIAYVVLQAKQYAHKVLVINDGSRDNTAEVAQLAGAEVISHSWNTGYGSAIIDIFASAKLFDADMLITLDADGQHDTEEIPKFVKAVQSGCDVVIGARLLDKHTIPLYRRVGQGLLRRMVNFTTGLRLTDTESGFRGYSRRAINTLQLKEKGMAVSSEIITEAARKKLIITEVPIRAIYS